MSNRPGTGTRGRNNVNENPSAATSGSTEGSTGRNRDRDGGDGSRSGPSTSSKNNTEETIDPDQATLDLVNELKNNISNNITITERILEKEVSDIRRKRNREKFGRKSWQNQLSQDIPDCSNDTLYLLMAYVDDPNQLNDGLKTKIKQLDLTIKSLEKIYDPLKKCYEELDAPSPRKLFRSVANINENQIDRAERMFYAEVTRFFKNSKVYTFELAHDQVQAIRFMRYEIDDEEEFRRFIECQNFDDAYAYLKKLAKRKVEQSGQSTSKNTKKSIVGESSSSTNDDTSNNNTRLYNSTSTDNNLSGQRYPSGQTASHGQKPDDKFDKKSQTGGTTRR